MDPFELEKLKYPIGKFNRPDAYTSELLKLYISEIEKFPAKISYQVKDLSPEQLNTHYRPGGWSIRQVVHHCADSHMNAIIRFKLTLTENKPTIKPYMEGLVAQLPDSEIMEITPSLEIISGVHSRWAVLLKSLTKNDLERIYIHPEYGKEFTLNEATGMYAWHCNHHLAHITTLKEMKNWK
ncbi:MAG: hypothetical protein K0S32_1361 [Bacteroidetes bacterium]|jgi:hypothetical protein|nr:hypothetical protein [Bacteroidota bacterium]